MSFQVAMPSIWRLSDRHKDELARSQQYLQFIIFAVCLKTDTENSHDVMSDKKDNNVDM